MDRSVTVSSKAALLAVIAALALVVAYLLGGGGGTAQAAPSSAPSSASSSRLGTMVTTGTGTTVGVPDELAFSVSVGLVRPTLDAAMSAASTSMSAVLATLKGQGVRSADVQTTGLQMNAVYDYHSYGPPTLRGYHVSQRAQVLVRDLTTGGKVVSAVVRTGGNDVRVGGLSLRIADPSALLAKSRAEAVQQAKAKAEEYAAATGQHLGAVESLREVHASAPAPHPLMFDKALAATPVLPVKAGQDRLAVTVRIVWSFA